MPSLQNDDRHPAYRKLANQLNSLPQEFPATSSGVELKILASLFSPEEAELASFLTVQAKDSKEMAALSGINPQQAKAMLRSLLKRGLIDWERVKGGFGYKIMPFVVGFYERQAGNIDSAFAALFETYYQEALHKSLTKSPSSHRVISVEKNIELGVEVLPFERASHYLEEAQSWGVLNCICRVQQKLVGKGCQHTVENCMVLSSKPHAFEHVDYIKTLSKEEAYSVLHQAEAEGLVHTTANSQQDVTYICNCCTCCCGFLRSVKEHGNRHPVAYSGYVAHVSAMDCAGCGECVEHCEFKAIALTVQGQAQVAQNLCIGCGICTLHCSFDALKMVAKDPDHLQPPPVTEGEWMTVREIARRAQEDYIRSKKNPL